MTMTRTELDALRASMRTEAEGEDCTHLELTASEALALLDALDETERAVRERMAREVEPAPLVALPVTHHSHLPADELAAKRAERQALVHLRAPSGQAIAACGAYPVERLTIHGPAVTCKRCLA